MALTYKVLAQSNPAATTSTDLYVVPAATTAVCSTLTVTNQTATDATFRVSVAVAGAVLAAKQYLAYDVICPASGLYAFTIGMTLGATDVVRVYSSTATMSFNLFGRQNT